MTMPATPAAERRHAEDELERRARHSPARCTTEKCPLCRDEYGTPLEMIERVRLVLGEIDLDPMSSAWHNEIVRATSFFGASDGALEREWFGRVFLNPPYSQPTCRHAIERFIEQALAGNISAGILLINSAPETRHYQSLLRTRWPVCHPASRVQFVHPNVAYRADRNRYAQALFYVGPRVADFHAVFGEIGELR